MAQAHICASIRDWRSRYSLIDNNTTSATTTDQTVCDPDAGHGSCLIRTNRAARERTLPLPFGAAVKILDPFAGAVLHRPQDDFEHGFLVDCRQDFLSAFGFGAGASRTSRGGGSIC